MQHPGYQNCHSGKENYRRCELIELYPYKTPETHHWGANNTNVEIYLPFRQILVSRHQIVNQASYDTNEGVQRGYCYALGYGHPKED